MRSIRILTTGFLQLSLLHGSANLNYSNDRIHITVAINRQNLVCPTHYNPADFFVHSMAVVTGREEESRARIIVLSVYITFLSITYVDSISLTKYYVLWNLGNM